MIAYELLDEVCDFGYMQVGVVLLFLCSSATSAGAGELPPFVLCSLAVAAAARAAAVRVQVLWCLTCTPPLFASLTHGIFRCTFAPKMVRLPPRTAMNSGPLPAVTHSLLPPCPQFTEAKILSEFIKTDAHRLAVQARPPMAVTNAVSWRQEGLFYKKNEVRAAVA